MCLQHNGGFLPGIILLTQCYYQMRGRFLCLQPMIPPKRFDIFLLDWGMLRRARCVQIFLYIITKGTILGYSSICYIGSRIGWVSMKEVYTSYRYRSRGDIGKLTNSIALRYILTSSACGVCVSHYILHF